MVGNISLWNFLLRVDVVDTVVLEWNQFWTGPWVGSWEHNILISREWVYPGTVHISLSNIWLLLSQGVNLSPLVFVTIHKPWHLLLGSRSDVEWWDSLGGEAPDILIHASLSNIFSIHLGSRTLEGFSALARLGALLSD